MHAEITGANEIYTTKRYINVYIAFMIQKSLEHVWRVEKYFKMLDFPEKQEKNTCLFRNTQHVSFHMYRSFGIIPFKCYVKIYLVFVFPDTFKWLLNYESYVHVYVSFRCIFLICSCHLSKHPLLCELLWYPSPDDRYWNRNVNVDFTSLYIFTNLDYFSATFILLSLWWRVKGISVWNLKF